MTALVPVLVAGSMPLALAACAVMGGSFAAWWTAGLLAMLPLLHVAPARHGHGARALGLVSLAPIQVAVVEWSAWSPLTHAWEPECGMGALGALALPFVAAALVAVALVFLSCVVSLGRVRALGAVTVLATAYVIVALGLQLVAAVRVGVGRDATQLLVVRVVTLGPLPSPSELEGGPIDVGGAIVSTVPAGPGSVTTIDGVVLRTLPEGPCEIAEGLGHRFVRGVGSTDPSRWLAYRVGDELGTRITSRSLAAVGAAVPSGLGLAFVACLGVALGYVRAALRGARRLSVLRRASRARVIAPGLADVDGTAATCDPVVPIGPAYALGRVRGATTYRTRACVDGMVSAAALDAERDVVRARIVEHSAAAAALAVLGSTPLLGALELGLAFAW